MALRILASLHNRIVVVAVAASAVIVGLVLAAVFLLRASELEQGFARTAQIVAGVVAERVEPALVAGDQAALQRAVRRPVERGTAVAVVVLDRERRVVAAEPAGAAEGGALAGWPTDVAVPAEITVRGVPALAWFQVIRGGEDDLGGLWIAIDQRPLRQAVGRFKFHTLIIAAGALAACIVGGLLAAMVLVRPHEELAATLAALARGELQARHPVAGPEEIRRAAYHLNRVAEQLQRSKDSNVEEKARQLEQHNRLLQQIGRLDPLTGLPNRLGLEDEMGRYISLCKRSGQPLAVIMLDLDGFKAYNDTLGHTAGDKALCTAAVALKGRARATDVVVRWGGDEFCILIPFTTPDRALAATEGFIAAVAEATRDLPRPETGALLGASAGVACFPEDGDEWQELINRADAALYRAKAAGTGRVLRASSPQPEVHA